MGLVRSHQLRTSDDFRRLHQYGAKHWQPVLLGYWRQRMQAKCVRSQLHPLAACASTQSNAAQLIGFVCAVVTCADAALLANVYTILTPYNAPSIAANNLAVQRTCQTTLSTLVICPPVPQSAVKLHRMHVAHVVPQLWAQLVLHLS